MWPAIIIAEKCMSVSIFRVQYLSEYAVSAQLGDAIDESTLQRITSFAALLREKPFTGFIDAVPAYVTLSVFYNPVQVVNATAMTGKTGFEKVSNYLSALYPELQVQLVSKGDSVVIPVCYGGQYGPDLDEVAGINNLNPEDVIALHTASVCKVFMIGFVPGFAYLGGMNERLATPRKATPRKMVPAGSVGIAGKQTGIYSLDTPGGWQIIGRTPFILFDADMPEPSLLKAGDQVSFRAIDEAEFERLRRKQHADSNQ